MKGYTFQGTVSYYDHEGERRTLEITVVISTPSRAIAQKIIAQKIIDHYDIAVKLQKK